MLDEPPDQNLIRVYRLPSGSWSARVGPENCVTGTGIAAVGPTGRIALSRLADELLLGGYEFDAGWEPAGGRLGEPLD